jgi:cell division protein FtsA
MKNDIVVGLDIGTTKIACLVGRRLENHKIEILGIGKSESVGVQRGVVSNIEKTVESIITAVKQAEAESGVDIKVVNVGIAGQHIKSIQQRGMRTRKQNDDEIKAQDIQELIQDMHQILMLPGEEIIHVLPQEFTIDGESGIKEPIGMFGIKLEANFHIISAQTNAIRNINRCIAKAGLTVEHITLEPLASAMSVLSHEEKEAGVVLVDIGGGTTDIAIFQEGIIRHTSVIPFGGDIITQDIKQGCSILKPHAEALKVQHGSALSTETENAVICIPGLKGRNAKEISTKTLASIIQARMEEILEHVYYEIKSSGYEKKLIAGIVLTGGGAQLRHMKQLVEYITGMDCRIGYPNEHVGKVRDESMLSPAFSTGVGLVIEGLTTGERQRSASNSMKVAAEETTVVVQEKNEDLGKGILERLRSIFQSDEE